MCGYEPSIMVRILQSSTVGVSHTLFVVYMCYPQRLACGHPVVDCTVGTYTQVCRLHFCWQGWYEKVCAKEPEESLLLLRLGVENNGFKFYVNRQMPGGRKICPKNGQAIKKLLRYVLHKDGQSTVLSSLLFTQESYNKSNSTSSRILSTSCSVSVRKQIRINRCPPATRPSCA